MDQQEQTAASGVDATRLAMQATTECFYRQRTPSSF